MNTVSGILKPKAPFDFQKTLIFLESFPPNEKEQIIKNKSLVKAVELSDCNLIFEISSIGSIDAPELKYTFYSTYVLNSKRIQEAENKIRFYLSLDDDLKKFYAISNNDEKFINIVQKMYGYRQVKFFSGFENACWAILSTRTPWKVAKKQKEELIMKYGGSIELSGRYYHTFPTPLMLANLSTDDVNKILNNTRKSEYLKNVIDFFLENDENNLKKMSYEELFEALMRIKGIGTWSSSFILLRGFGKMDFLPSGEKILNSIIQTTYNDTNFNTLQNLYYPFVGYWAHYLRAYQNMY